MVRETDDKVRIRIVPSYPTMNTQDDTGKWWHFLGGQSYAVPEHIAEQAIAQGWGAPADDLDPGSSAPKSSRKKSK